MLLLSFPRVFQLVQHSYHQSQSLIQHHVTFARHVINTAVTRYRLIINNIKLKHKIERLHTASCRFCIMYKLGWPYKISQDAESGSVGVTFPRFHA